MIIPEFMFTWKQRSWKCHFSPTPSNIMGTTVPFHFISGRFPGWLLSSVPDSRVNRVYISRAAAKESSALGPIAPSTH